MSFNLRRIDMPCEMLSITRRRFNVTFVIAVLVLLPIRWALATEKPVELDIWVQQAPLTLVIEQIASVAGKNAKFTGSIEGQVSGRLTGDLTDNLVRLSDSHGVLFDVQGDDLHVISNRAMSSVSMSLPGAGLIKSIQQTLDEAPFPGNTVFLQEGKVKVSGHPNFVKRIVRRMGSGQSVYSVKKVAPTVKLAKETVVAEPELSAAILDKQAPADAIVSNEAELSTTPNLADEVGMNKPITVKQVVRLEGSIAQEFEPLASPVSPPSDSISQLEGESALASLDVPEFESTTKSALEPVATSNGEPAAVSSVEITAGSDIGSVNVPEVELADGGNVESAIDSELEPAATSSVEIAAVPSVEIAVGSDLETLNSPEGEFVDGAGVDSASESDIELAAASSVESPVVPNVEIVAGSDVESSNVPEVELAEGSNVESEYGPDAWFADDETITNKRIRSVTDVPGFSTF